MGVRALALLNERPENRDAGRAQQLLELEQLGRGRLGSDANGALARASSAHAASFPSRSIAALNRSSGVVSEILKKPSPLGP